MMYVCILNNQGDIVLHKNIATDPAKFLALIEPYRENLVIGVECIFSSALTPVSPHLLHPCSRGIDLPIPVSSTSYPLF